VTETVTAPALEMRGITKRYPGVVANDGIDLDIRPGEIHALLGENGAGKTTLVRILAGLVRPDSGTILIDDVPLELDSPKAAIGAGIALVSQHPLVSGALTVFENIISARVNQRIGLLDVVSLRREIENIAASCGFDIDLDRPLWRADRRPEPDRERAVLRAPAEFGGGGAGRGADHAFSERSDRPLR
jgi:ABC-type uncharacterized transport system ATPase subunit